MAFIQESFSRASFKLIIGKSHTSNERDPANEPIKSDFTIAGQNVFADFIDPDPAVSIASGVCSELITLDLEPVSGTNNSGIYTSYRCKLGAVVPYSLSGKINKLTGNTYAPYDYVGAIIPQKMGDNYRPKLYIGVVETPPLDASDWFIDTSSGVITQESDILGNMIDYSTNGTIKCYIYTGKYVTDIGGGGAGDNLVHVEIDDNYTAGCYEMLLIDSRLKSINVSLPATPIDGCIIALLDVYQAFDQHNVTIIGNGHTIAGPENQNFLSMDLDIEGTSTRLRYTNDDGRWHFILIPGIAYSDVQRGVDFLELDFDYTDVPSGQIDIGEILAGKIVESVFLNIIDVFDDNTTLTIGDDSAQARIMAVSDLNLKYANFYEKTVGEKYVSSTTLKVYFSNNAPTTGAGKIIINLG